MTIVDVIVEFADALTDALSPPVAAGSGGELSHLFATASRTGLDDERLGRLLVELNRVMNLSTTAVSAATAAAEKSGMPRRKRVKTGADLLKQIGVTPSAAHRLARVGRAATIMPGLMARARVGGVPIEQADAVGKGIAFVDKRIRLDDDRRTDLARRLAAQATPADVERRAREIALDWAPDVPDDTPDAVPVAENTDLNELASVTGEDGRTVATWDVDALTGEELSQALDPLCKPVPQPDGSADPRSATQRRSDALAQVIREYLAGRDRPTVAGGVRPHVTLIVPTAVPRTPTDTQVCATTAPEESSPEESSPVASLGFTGPVSAATVGLVICDAAMRRVVLDGESAPLDVGREHRLVTVALRKALEARDRGCAFPGCGRPVSWTDAHHCVPWSEGGVTAIDNCVLLCRMHHVTVHQTGWEVFIGHDRHPWFRPPIDREHPDRFREAIRSNARRTLTSEPTAAA